MTPVHIAARSADLEILKYLWAWCGIICEGEENQFGPFSEEDNVSLYSTIESVDLYKVML